jgi:hypothetical protein
MSRQSLLVTLHISGGGNQRVRYGSVVLALGLLASAAIAYRASAIDPRHRVSSTTIEPARFGPRAGSPAPSTPAASKR